jgi:hypothetical protein
MTERKPAGTSFTSWIDQQISEAEKRGAFDDLPGAGKPIPNRGPGDAQAWLQDYLRREGVSAEVLLPTPLKLRKEIERLDETVRDLRTEQEVREVVADLNRRIVEWRRFPVGPPIFLSLMDAEKVVSRWQDRPSGAAPIPPPAPVERSGTLEGSGTPAGSPRPRWWHRLRRRQRDTPL